MVDKHAYPSTIAAEAVGERLDGPSRGPGEHAVRPVATSTGELATLADTTAESVGERVGDAYADATMNEARERSRRVARHAATGERSQAAGRGLFGQFDQQTFVAAFAAFALGYAAALLINRSNR
jgi:hypothetical protein